MVFILKYILVDYCNYYLDDSKMHSRPTNLPLKNNRTHGEAIYLFKKPFPNVPVRIVKKILPILYTEKVYFTTRPCVVFFQFYFFFNLKFQSFYLADGGLMFIHVFLSFIDQDRHVVHGHVLIHEIAEADQTHATKCCQQHKSLVVLQPKRKSFNFIIRIQFISSKMCVHRNAYMINFYFYFLCILMTVNLNTDLWIFLLFWFT